MNDQSMHFDPVVFRPIGIIRSLHRQSWTIQQPPLNAPGSPGQAQLLPQYREGLKELHGYSHVFLVYHLHPAGPPKLVVYPLTGGASYGIFSTRRPQRPNAIGLSIIRLVRVDLEAAILHLEDVDIPDETPLLDIKPFVPRFDCVRAQVAVGRKRSANTVPCRGSRRGIDRPARG